MTFTQFRDFEKLRFTKKLDRTQNRGEPLGGGVPPKGGVGESPPSERLLRESKSKRKR